MSEELSLVTELAIILIAAGVFTVISKALKQPVILGYIVAGFLVGPKLGIFPQFSSESIHVWSELGIIFLLFGLGLEFSFKKLLKVGSSALLTAGVNCIGMMTIGIIAGNALGWTFMESVFLGGLLSMSSTTIIIKAYDDMGLKKKSYAQLIFGTLVVEDLIAVLLLVLLSTLAVSNKFAGGEMVLALAKLIVFIVLSFVIGIYLIPTLFKRARQFLSDEILLLVSVGLCLFMVWLANLAGFSSALGAFLMGSILSETFEGEKILKLTSSVKDLFGAIFFISVGMMVDPAVIAEHWAPVLVITVLAMGGIMLCSSTGAILSGQGLDTAVHVGFSLAQLGEFSFIIAGLGCSLGVMRDFIYPVIISVSVITTFTTPYMIKAADPVSLWLQRKLSARILDRITPVQKPTDPSNNMEKLLWSNLIKSYFVRLAVYSVVLIAISALSALLLGKGVTALLPDISASAHNWICLIVELLLMSPFLYGLAVVNSDTVTYAAKILLKSKSSNAWVIIGLMTMRVAIATLFVIVAVSSIFELTAISILLVILADIVIYLVSRFTIHRTAVIETRFLSNLNEKDREERKKKIVRMSVNDKLASYNVHIGSVTVSPDSRHVGQQLRDMPFRHSCGVNIIKIGRGTRSILIPSGDEYIYPGDLLLAVGTQDQLDAFEKTMAEDIEVHDDSASENFVVETLAIAAGSILDGASLREAKMRSLGCMVISVLHGDKLITNPGPEYRFTEGDRIWIAGEKTAVKLYE